MERVLEFICEKVLELELELNDYPVLIPLLEENFDIRDYSGQKAAEELINTVIWWENHWEIYDSLEKTLDDRFFIRENL